MKRACALLLLSGCVLLNAERNVQLMKAIVTVRGSVQSGYPTFLVLYRLEDGAWHRYASRVFHVPSTFEILTEPGTLKLFAFTDATSAWRQGDFSGVRELVDIPPGKVVDVGAVNLLPNGPSPPEEIDFCATDAPRDRVVLHRGDVTTLDDERFALEAGRLGLWQPADFALKYGLGVSFLEPYDPKKTPVLFVHGASGTPQHFKAVIEALDRTRFQPWVFSYPSGSRLDRVSATLTQIVDDLRAQLHFKQLLVVGYSMGGLVAHTFVSRVSYVPLLVTLSTPYGGDEAARVGVQRSPIVVPFWIDMSEGSPFLKALRVPMAARHVMFFSFRGRGDDGTVSLRTMLVPEIQEAAVRVEGFDETHDTMVTSPKVVAAVNAALLQTQPP